MQKVMAIPLKFAIRIYLESKVLSRVLLERARQLKLTALKDALCWAQKRVPQHPHLNLNISWDNPTLPLAYHSARNLPSR
jgi:hypothetical protein